MFAFFKPELPRIVDVSGKEFLCSGILLRASSGHWQIALEFSVSDAEQLEETMNFLIRGEKKIKVH